MFCCDANQETKNQIYLMAVDKKEYKISKINISKKVRKSRNN